MLTSTAHGMIRGENVASALARIMPLCDHGWFAVLRSVDSAYELADLTRVLKVHHLAYDVINGNVCLSLNTLEKAVSDGLFTGFDEVWIVDGVRPAFDLAPLPSATSDSTDFSSDLPQQVSRAMDLVRCVLIVGDGCGLNYATTSAQLQQELAKFGP